MPLWLTVLVSLAAWLVLTLIVGLATGRLLKRLGGD